MSYITSHFPWRQLKPTFRPRDAAIPPCPMDTNLPQAGPRPAQMPASPPPWGLVYSKQGQQLQPPQESPPSPLVESRAESSLDPCPHYRHIKAFITHKANSCKAFPSRRATCNKVTAAHTQPLRVPVSTLTRCNQGTSIPT